MSVALPPPGPSRVHLDLHDTTVHLALAFAAEEAGWVRVGTRGPATALVADRLPADPVPGRTVLDVLVIHPTPAASRRALDAFGEGLVRAVLPASRPQDLPVLLDPARRHLGVVPVAVVQAAHRFPALGPRLEQTLGLVLRGWSNRAIAGHVHQSEATTKRDVAELLRRFDAPNRMALAATAIRLGVHPDGRPPPDRAGDRF